MCSFTGQENPTSTDKEQLSRMCDADSKRASDAFLIKKLIFTKLEVRLAETTSQSLHRNGLYESQLRPDSQMDDQCFSDYNQQTYAVNVHLNKQTRKAACCKTAE